MSNIPVRDLGGVGIVKDTDPFSLPPNAFSDGMNVRFDNNMVRRAPIYRIFHNALTGTVPTFCYGWYDPLSFDSVIYANNDGRLFSIANYVETNVTPSGWTNFVDGRPYTGCTLSGCIYLNRPDGPPHYINDSHTTFQPLPAFGVVGGVSGNWTCKSLRSFQSFLIMLNVTAGTTSQPNMFQWSDAAAEGVPPASWDYTDTTKLAGQNPISQLRTEIVDGLALGNVFIVYSHDEVWLVTYLGQGLMFDFQRLPFDNVGLVNVNCMVEVNGQHVCWGENDIYVHNGVTKESIIEGKNREVFFRELNMKESARFFVAHDKYRHSVMFCGVSGSNNAALLQKDATGCNYAAVWNYLYNTWSFMDLPNVTSSTTANANTVWTYEDIDPAFNLTGCPNPALTYANVGGSYFDQEDSFSRYCMFTQVSLGAPYNYASQITVLDDPNFGKIAYALDPTTVQPAWAQRIGFDMEQEGAALRSYKSIRAFMPQVSLLIPSATLSITLGAHLTSASPVSWDAPVNYDPSTQYKINSRQGGRFLAYQFNMPTANDFHANGFDLDAIVTGNR